MLLTLSLLACKPVAPVKPVQPAISMNSVVSGQQIAGFFVEGVYTDHQGVPRGARLVHGASGFLLRLIEMDTAPAAMVAVGTVPEDDRGTPHTQEHLLLGKGNVGRAVADAEAFQLVDSSAFTERMRTVYHFRTAAGVDGFFPVFEQRLHALLFPDYTDEEIRREVYHLGVEGEPGDLKLVEKGTVYAEMQRSSQQASRRMWNRMEDELYGPAHPQALSSGGDPDAMRSLTPERIREYHARTHVLGNMNAVVFLRSGDLRDRLARFDDVLGRLPVAAGERRWTPTPLPRPKTREQRGRVRVPVAKEEEKGTVNLMLAWPPSRGRTNQEDLLLELFFTEFTGSSSSQLHRALVDREHRERDTGAQAVWSWQGEDMPGAPILMGVDDLPLETDDATLDWLQQRVIQEFRTIVSWEPGDPELLAFNERVRAAFVDRRRETRMTLAEPPGFGTRGTGSAWMSYLEALDLEGGFARSLALPEAFAYAERRLNSNDNVWAELIRREGWLDRPPLAFATQPDPSLLAQLETDRVERLDGELAALMQRTSATDAQEALRGLAEEFEARTEALTAARSRSRIGLVADPPLDDDPELPVVETSLAGLPAVRVDVPTMTGARVELVFDARRVPTEHLGLLPVFDVLLRRVGMTVDGESLEHDEVQRRLQREVRTVTGRFQSNNDTGRLEYALVGEGTDLAESRAAVGWMRRLLSDSTWSEANLGRLRSVVAARSDRRLDKTPSNWTSSLRVQDDLAMVHARVGAARQLDTLRMKWRLTDAGADLEAVVAAFEQLGAGRSVSDGKVPLVDEARRDLERMVRDLPEATRSADQRALAALLVADLRTPPAQVLADLRAVRAALFVADARWVVTGGEVIEPLLPDLSALVAGLPEPGERPALVPGSGLERIAARGVTLGSHVAWRDPERAGGSVYVRAPFPTLDAVSDDDLLAYVAAGTVAGGGAGSLFMKTWGEGLAYSNGSSVSVTSGSRTWSATRCPNVAETAQFAVDRIVGDPIESFDLDYAVANAFRSTAHLSPSRRASAWAQRVADGRRPDSVRAFRQRLLDLALDPNDAWLERRTKVYADVFPALGGADSAGAAGVFTQVTGDDRQLAAWNEWLVANGHPAAVVLYPRDFWELGRGATP